MFFIYKITFAKRLLFEKDFILRLKKKEKILFLENYFKHKEKNNYFW